MFRLPRMDIYFESKLEVKALIACFCSMFVKSVHTLCLRLMHPAVLQYSVINCSGKHRRI